MNINGELLTEEQTVTVLWSLKHRLRQLRKLRDEHADNTALVAEANRSIARIEALWPLLINGGIPPSGLEGPSG